MSLPKISHPTFTLELPSTGQKITYRPFLVKEEKVLLIAQQSENQAESLRAIRQVIQNCILSDGVDVNDFATFDLEYFFIQLRSKSVNNIVKLSYRDKDDQKVYDFEVDLEDIKLTSPAKTSNVVEVSDNLGIRLRYPRVDLMEKVDQVESPAEFVFLLLKNCMYEIFDDKNTFKVSEYSDEEVDEFINSLDVKSYQKVQEFFDSIPKLEHVLSYTNSNGKDVKITLNTLSDFFTLG